MKKSIVALVVFALLCITLYPSQSYALSEVEKINRQMEQIKKDQNNRVNEKKELVAQKEEEQKTLDQLMTEIDQQAQKKQQLENQINDTQADLNEAGKQLDEAIQRVEARDKVMKSRIQLMYTNGFVSYLEVLLSSTSFSDFLDRYNMLTSIVNQDKKILEDNKKDRDLQVEKKQQIEEDLTTVTALYQEAKALSQKLNAQEKQKEVVIASLAQKVEHIDETSKEEDDKLVQLARQQAAAIQKERASKKGNKVTAVSYTGGKFLWPAPGYSTITSGFGSRIDPVTGKAGASHNGIDIGAPNGSTIVAAESGVVLIASYVNGYGNCVVIDHGNGLWTYYGHIRPNGIKVEVGDNVKRGQKIAEVGTTGKSTGYHLHFEVRKDGVAVNPIPYLKS